ncbi:Uu.00g053320.m01.CDS01 [Anthostomella pinea]|uniref:Uu.00g053320.m01.CDS01 n=1 Tax=Anthostomella pinea TaxID=933095 RepID=A0AAI8YM47_9PEZI|nr:Uu.00g053320.m01.CDS01 [Anthostomella pinea]
MKFLCLHGMGTSAAIFKVQTSAFRAKLPPGEHTFTFVNAPHECDATRAISPFFPGPHYTFCRNYTIPEVEAAPLFILAILDAARAAGEPYDALICFSQGSALAAGLLMAHRIERPGTPLPVRGIVFICGGVPLPLLEVWGLRVPKKAFEINELTGRDLQRKAAAAGMEIRALMEGGGVDGACGGGGRGATVTKSSSEKRPPLVRRQTSLWRDTTTLYHRREVEMFERQGGDDNKTSEDGLDPKALPPLEADDVYGLNLTDIPEHLVIDIPTVHIYGIKDPRYPAAVQLAWFCNPDKRRVFDTGGGHEIPRSSQVSREIADAIVWLQDMVSREDSL